MTEYELDKLCEKNPDCGCKDPKINEAFRNLHEKLVNEVIGFCKAWNISIDEFHLSADGLNESIKYGSWHPCTDSCLVFEKSNQDEPFLFSI